MSFQLSTMHPTPGAGGPRPRAGRPEPPFPPPTPRPPTRPEPMPVPQPLPPTVHTVMHAPAAPAAPDPTIERLLRERIVFLGREVDDEVANRICAQLLLLAAEDGDRDISLYINSPGGSVTAGMAIYDTMRLITPDVATWAVGFAASMGQFLLTAGAPGKRHALPHTRIMMHQPSAGLSGPASEVAVRTGIYAAMKREIAELIAEHSGQPVETITADSDRDRWFTAREAQEYGLIDHIAG
jgi:ATP-dependent Clp protease, protease subunit